MTDPGPPASSRVLFLLTLLGLVGCALVAIVHPAEHYDPERGLEQTGRHLQVTLEVTESRNGDGWASGDALPLKTNGYPHPKTVSWTWFRVPDDVPQPGDRVQGRALLSQDRGGTEFMLDGPRAAHVTPGPLPVPVHWDTLLAHPDPLAGRLLRLNGQLDGDRIAAPDGTASCRLVEVPAGSTHASSWLLRLERDRDQPGWSCRLEGPA